MGDRPVITGMGVVCPSGCTLEEFQHNLWSGSTSIELQHIRTGPESGAAIWSGRQPDLVSEDYMTRRVIDQTDRAHQYAIAAGEMARRDAELERFDPRRSAIVSGSSSGGSASTMYNQYLLDKARLGEVSTSPWVQSLGNMAAAQMAMRWDIHGPQITLCHACATGVDVVGTAADLIREGRVDVAIAGGYDGGSGSWLSSGDDSFLPATRAAQVAYGMAPDPEDPHPSRPFDKKRTGVVSAEGAGFVIVESAEHAASRGRSVWATVEGYGSLADGYHPSSPEPSGRWEQEVMLQAIRDAGLEPDDIDGVVAHGTSTVKGDESEINALNAIFGDRPKPIPVTSIKGHMGHPGAASGCLAIIAGAIAMRAGSLVHTAGTDEVEDSVRFEVLTGSPRPIRLQRVLVNAFGFGGQDASVVLGAPAGHS